MHSILGSIESWHKTFTFLALACDTSIIHLPRKSVQNCAQVVSGGFRQRSYRCPLITTSSKSALENTWRREGYGLLYFLQVLAIKMDNYEDPLYEGGKQVRGAGYFVFFVLFLKCTAYVAAQHNITLLVCCLIRDLNNVEYV